MTEPTNTLLGAYSQPSSISTCFASSRVGVITTACGRATPSVGRVLARTTFRTEKPMASVLPEPVCELMRKSRSASDGSSTASCTGVSVA